MAGYRVINELMAMQLHDSSLESVCIMNDELSMMFSHAIIIGDSRPDIPGHVRCSANSGEDRYAVPNLRITLREYNIISFKREAGEANEKCELSTDEYMSVFHKIHGYNHVYSLEYDPATDSYSLGFILSEDDCYYTLEFTAETAIAEFDDYGKAAWYLEDKWRAKDEDQ